MLADWKGLNPEYVRQTVRKGISVMPRFRRTEISDAELDALVHFVAR